MLVYVGLFAEDTLTKEEALEKNCLACHKKEQIPNTLVYRRYLVKYSTHDTMKQAIVKYLKNPQQEHSVMPPPFFLKFAMKKTWEMDDKTLDENTEAFLEKFDMKKKLILSK